MINQKIALILRGTPGSGKSTFVEFASKKSPKAAVHAIDDLHRDENGNFLWDEDNADRLRCIDIALRKLNANELNYYCIFDAGRKVPVNFISDINDSLNKDMNRFLALRSEDGNGDVGQILMHKRIGGNRDKSFLDKIEHTTRSQGCPNLLQKTSEIVSG